MRFVVYALAAAIVAMQPRPAQEPLTSVAAIELPRVDGRIGHLAFDAASERLFVAALGNDTVDVVDVKAGKHLRSLPGFREPQGIAAAPDARLVAVANGEGEGVQFVGDDFRMTQGVRLGDDSDNVRYDATAKRVYDEGDTDDLFYDAARKRLYVSAGEGFIDVFQSADANRFTRLARVPTAPGARTSLFVPDPSPVFLAVPHRGSQRAEIRVCDVR